MSDRHLCLPTHNNDVSGTGGHVPPAVVSEDLLVYALHVSLSALDDLVLEPKRGGVVGAVGFLHSDLGRDRDHLDNQYKHYRVHDRPRCPRRISTKLQGTVGYRTAYYIVACQNEQVLRLVCGTRTREYASWFSKA